jgi:hypothetical protein
LFALKKARANPLDVIERSSFVLSLLPFKFRLIKVPYSKTLYYKNTLISVK